MRARHAVLAAFAAAVTLASIASAGSGVAKQRIQLTVQILPGGNGVLTPLQQGGLEVDRGTFGGDWASHTGSHVMRDGQSIDRYTATWAFTGKKGTLVFRERNEWTDIGSDANGDGSSDGVAFGKWKVVRGTGQYAGIVGGGRSGHSGLGRKWFARYEGFLTAR